MDNYTNNLAIFRIYIHELYCSTKTDKAIAEEIYFALPLYKGEPTVKAFLEQFISDTNKDGYEVCGFTSAQVRRFIHKYKLS